MPNVEYANIEPLIAEQEQKGSCVSVKFRCPETGVEADASGSVRRSSTVKSTTERSVKKNIWGSLRRAVTSTISSTLGSGTAGRIARDVANKTIGDQAKNAEYTKEEVRAAIVSAFESVQSKFEWNVKEERWQGAQSADTPFAKQIAERPIEAKYDRGVLARALVELSCADGTVSDAERDFIGDFIDPEIGTIDELAQREKLTAAELSETSAGARDSLLMLSWACALCDEDLDSAERARLEEIAGGLGIDANRAAELQGTAQQFLFEQALNWAYPGGKRDDSVYAEVMAAASRLGLDADAAAKFDVAFRKRKDIV